MNPSPSEHSPQQYCLTLVWPNAFLINTHHSLYRREKKKQHKDPSSESLSTAPAAQKSSSPLLFLSRQKKKARPQVWHTVQTPDSVFVRLLMASAAGGVGSATNISPRECFPKQNTESHQCLFLSFLGGRRSRWELIESYRSHPMWGEKSRSSQELMKEANVSVIWSSRSFTASLFLP